MKCPKCGYLGFETTERCRHCGYDFSLSVTADNDAAAALPLRDRSETEAPLNDFDLGGCNTEIDAEPAAALDLNRVIGDPTPASPPQAHSAERAARAVEASTAVATPPALPLFTASPKVLDDAPVTPPPARAPLAVRRATPEVPRRRAPRMIRHDVDEISLRLEPVAHATESSESGDAAFMHAATAVRRVVAALVDTVILGGISAAVVYLTLAITGLSLAEWRIVPPVPMVAFLLLLNGGYLAGFTAANGQTIGKMTARIRVVTDQGGRVNFAGAVVRAAGALVSLALAGLPFLPALVSPEGRALHDRLAGTRVVRESRGDRGGRGGTSSLISLTSL